MQDLVAFPLRAAGLVTGAAIILIAAGSAVRTLVLTRSARDPITVLVFFIWRTIFNMFTRRATTYERRDRIMALYAPVALFTLAMSWMTLTSIGYTLVYYGMGVTRLYDAFALSGSALTTLGFARHDGWLFMAVLFSEASVGLILVALLISYLPTMYSAFAGREAAVTMLEVRAGTPPTPIALIARANRIHGLDDLTELWAEWETWFAGVEESHTSLAPLIFFRSSKPSRHWITAAGVVLDSAAIYAAAVDVPRNPQAELCIRSGYLALRSIADFFELRYDPDPASDDTISISRSEFEQAYDQLAAQDVPLKADRDACWEDFAGWRVNYDAVLLKLAALTMAPYAPWVSDRSLPGMGGPTMRRTILGFHIRTKV